MEEEIKTEILIHVTPEIVWEILTDIQDFPNWNPFITSLTGELSIGKKINVSIQPLGTKGMNFSPIILAFEKNKELRWIGKFLFTGLFDGEHSFHLIDNHDGTTTFQQNEKFKGLLVSAFKKQLNIGTKKGFEAMNQKLKEKSENKKI